MPQSTSLIRANVIDARIIDAPEPPSAADSLANGLRQLAHMVETNPTLVDEYRMQGWFERYLIPVYTRKEVAAYTRAGLSAGARVVKHQNDQYAGVDIHFGPMWLHIYIDRAQVCERIVTGTREVTKEVPDPEALAAVPKVTKTETVEDVEWRCLPLLAELPDDAPSRRPALDEVPW